MQLVPAVTELLIAEIMYLQYRDRNKPMFLYINSTGTTRADGETVSSSNFDPGVIEQNAQACRHESA